MRTKLKKISSRRWLIILLFVALLGFIAYAQAERINTSQNKVDEASTSSTEGDSKGSVFDPDSGADIYSTSPYIFLEIPSSESVDSSSRVKYDDSLLVIKSAGAKESSAPSSHMAKKNYIYLKQPGHVPSIDFANYLKALDSLKSLGMTYINTWPAGEWKDIDSPDGGFKVAFPSPPKRSLNRMLNRGYFGIAPHEAFTTQPIEYISYYNNALLDDTWYMVQYITLASKVDTSDDRKVLEKYIENIAKSKKSMVLENSSYLKVAGYPAVDATASDSEAEEYTSVRVIKVNKTLYSLMAIGEKDSPKHVDKFFKSFSFYPDIDNNPPAELPTPEDVRERERAVELVKQRPEVMEWLRSHELNPDDSVRPVIEFNGFSGGDHVVQVYNLVRDDDKTSHTGTFDWYYVHLESGRVSSRTELDS